MRRHTCLLLAAGMLVGCGAPPSTAPSAQPSDAVLGTARAITSDANHLDVVAPRALISGDGPTGSADAPREASPAATSPETTASNAVLQLVEDEELLVLDLNASLTDGAEGSAVVEVRVLFGTGRSHPQEATYLVRLVEDAGDWAVTDLEVAP